MRGKEGRGATFLLVGRFHSLHSPSLPPSLPPALGDVDDEDVKRAPSVSLPSTEVAATREEEEEGEGEEQGGESDIDSDVSELSDIDI